MFSKKYAQTDAEIRGILANVTPPNSEDIREILEKSKSERISLEEIAQLLEVEEEQFDLVRNFVFTEFKKEKNTLRHIAPVYLSSYCIDTCGYCNYSAKRKNVERTRLGLSDLEEELGDVLSVGNRVIEFTLATDPALPPRELVKYISKTKEILGDEKGSGILLCSDYFSKEDYVVLREAGLWGMVQWDETLDRNKYQRWHRNSPRKSHFEERIDTHDRAIQAGLEVAAGCLFGLSDYKYDVLMQIAKARHLEQEYGSKPFVFGTPRIKAIAGKRLRPRDEVTDRQYGLALMVYKIAEPQIARWLQTRETPELNLRNAVDKDAYTYKCGEVKPGGYKINRHAINAYKGGQFRVNEMTEEQFERELEIRNFKVDYAWIR